MMHNRTVPLGPYLNSEIKKKNVSISNGIVTDNKYNFSDSEVYLTDHGKYTQCKSIHDTTQIPNSIFKARPGSEA